MSFQLRLISLFSVLALCTAVWAQPTSEDAYLVDNVTPDMHIRLVQQIEESASKIAPSQPGGYVVIPIHGGVGWLCDASLVREAIRLIDSASTPVPLVVLDIYSPGGLVNDTIEIINTIAASKKSKGYKVVAYVREAGSAAAVIALLADEIYMEPGSNINSVLMNGIWGQRKAGERIIHSHQHERMYNAAQVAVGASGRDVLWADAMVKSHVTIYAQKQADGSTTLISRSMEIPIVTNQKSDWRLRGFSANSLLLKSPDAIRFGLAKAEVTSYPEMLQHAGFENLHIGPAYATRAYIKRGNDWRLAVRHTQAWLDRLEKFRKWNRPVTLTRRDIDTRKSELLSLERTLPPVFLAADYHPSQKEFVARFTREFKDLEGFRSWHSRTLAGLEGMKPTK
jgi:ATP-dependent protease ClpP protease subunit